MNDTNLRSDPSIALPAAVITGGTEGIGRAFAEEFARDGHALVLSGAGPVVNSIMGRGLGYKDITPLAMMAAEYVGIAVRADSSLRSGRDIITALKKDPQALTFGIANSLGNANHQAVALALKTQGIPPGKAKNVVPVKSDKLTLNIKDPKFTIELKPEKLDTDGKTSSFVGKDDRFGKVQEFAGSVTVVVEGTPWTGDFEEKPHHDDKKK